MARVHGRNARLYMGVASGAATAEPLNFLNSIDASFTSDRVDTTSFGDAGKTYVAGLPDGSGSFAGFFDVSAQQTYTAAADGAARKTYVYPDIVNSPGTYWFATAFFDFNLSLSVTDAAKIQGTFNAATAFARVG